MFRFVYIWSAGQWQVASNSTGFNSLAGCRHMIRCDTIREQKNIERKKRTTTHITIISRHLKSSWRKNEINGGQPRVNFCPDQICVSHSVRASCARYTTPIWCMFYVLCVRLEIGRATRHRSPNFILFRQPSQPKNERHKKITNLNDWVLAAFTFIMCNIRPRKGVFCLPSACLRIMYANVLWTPLTRISRIDMAQECTLEFNHFTFKHSRSAHCCCCCYIWYFGAGTHANANFQRKC